MRKIPTLFERDPENRSRVLAECAVDLPADAIATAKFDGTGVLIGAAGPHARRIVKPRKRTPDGFMPIEYDDATGKTVGWEPMHQSGFVKFYKEAAAADLSRGFGTYELIGPKINGNPHGVEGHRLVEHGTTILHHVPTTDYGLAIWLRQSCAWEGVVWWYDGAPVAKIKRRDFGYDWPITPPETPSSE